jgi:hypothetical protein
MGNATSSQRVEDHYPHTPHDTAQDDDRIEPNRKSQDDDHTVFEDNAQDNDEVESYRKSQDDDEDVPGDNEITQERRACRTGLIRMAKQLQELQELQSTTLTPESMLVDDLIAVHSCLYDWNLYNEGESRSLADKMETTRKAHTMAQWIVTQSEGHSSFASTAALVRKLPNESELAKLKAAHAHFGDVQAKATRDSERIQTMLQAELNTISSRLSDLAIVNGTSAPLAGLGREMVTKSSRLF